MNLLRWRLGRLLAGRPLRLAAQAVSVGLLLLIVTAGLIGDQNPTRNFAPIWVWVIWWVGFAYLSALAGNLWAAVNPWAAIFGWAEALVRRLAAAALALGLPYPRRLGMWPAIVLFAAFAWIELVYSGRTMPAQLALMIDRLLADHLGRDDPLRARRVAAPRRPVRRGLRLVRALLADRRSG